MPISGLALRLTAAGATLAIAVTGHAIGLASHAPRASETLGFKPFGASGFAPAGPLAFSGSLPARPNILLVLTDDQRAGTDLAMPTVAREIIDKGLRFTNGVVPTSWCCPSRSSLLTGRFSHSTGVWDNSTSVPYGGYPAFVAGGEPQTLATTLSASGYRTGLFGKYLNGLELSKLNYKPPGWDEFVAFRGSGNGYTDFPTNDGVRHADTYSTDYFADMAERFIRSTPQDEPVFAYYAPFAPHSPYIPGPYEGSAAEGMGTVSRETGWPGPSMGPASRAGKHPWLRRLNIAERLEGRSAYGIDEIPRAQQDALMGVDAAVGRFIAALSDTGRLENTLVVYVSDNGYSWGEHDLVGKNTPYRSSVEVPLAMRWDAAGLPNAEVSSMVAANIDVTATILEATGTSLPDVDGVSVFSAVPRSGVLLEATIWRGTPRRPAYCGWRTERYMFVRYSDGFEELYDYALDPYELHNVASDPSYKAVRDYHAGEARAGCSPAPPYFTWDIP